MKLEREGRFRFLATMMLAAMAAGAPAFLAGSPTLGAPGRQVSTPRKLAPAQGPPVVTAQAEPAPPARPEPQAPRPGGDPSDSAKAAAKPVATARIDALRAEYDSLKDALFRSRARRETLENALFSTKLVVRVRWDGGRHQVVKHAEVRLDGVRLWETADGLTGNKPIDLAVKSAPPGPHILGVRVEVRSRENPKLGYVSDQSFALPLTEGKKTQVEITIDEDADVPSYNPDIEIEVDTD